MTNNIAEFMSRIAHIDGNREIMKPDLCLATARPNMDVGRLPALVRIKVGAIRTPAQNGRHVVPSPAIVSP
jgi:hypothetical protein